MKNSSTIKINFRGGIISPGDLYNILVACNKAGIRYVSFGLRQQLLIPASIDNRQILMNELDTIGIVYETGNDLYPNIVSSYLQKKFSSTIPGSAKVCTKIFLMASIISPL
jgi:hypothetical protein